MIDKTNIKEQENNTISFKIGDKVSKVGSFHSGIIITLNNDNTATIKTNEGSGIVAHLDGLCYEHEVVHTVMSTNIIPSEGTSDILILMTTKDLDKAIDKVREMRDKFIEDNDIDIENESEEWGIIDEYDDFESNVYKHGHYSVWILTTKME